MLKYCQIVSLVNSWNFYSRSKISKAVEKNKQSNWELTELLEVRPIKEDLDIAYSRLNESLNPSKKKFSKVKHKIVE